MNTTFLFPSLPDTLPSGSIVLRSLGSAAVSVPANFIRVPFGRIRSSKSTAIVPDLLIRFAGVTEVTWPSTTDPAGIAVLPST
jgi:hypothetical protein